MWLIRSALRAPFTVLVLVLATVLAAVMAIRTAPADIFPEIGAPVIYVVQPYAGMSPAQMEGQLVHYYEYHFLYIAGIEHIESQSIQGMGMLKLYFHPGTDIAQAMAQVTAMAFRATSFMPPGTLPPFIVRFDAGTVPVGQLVFSSDTRSEAEIQDVVVNRVRPLLATLPGASAPPPSGGKVRTIVAYLDATRLRAHRISPDEVATVIARANVTLPSGNVRTDDVTAIATVNAMVASPASLMDLPLRVGSGPTVHLRDVARVEDGADVVYNIALANGRRTVYMPVTKRADASTLDVVAAIREALPQMRALVPEDVRIELEFDQSGFVTGAIRGLVEEGLLGAVLTGLVVLLFLRSVRSALIVVITIPASILAASVALRIAGETINVMTLSGLALAVGILVDESTVAIENIHTHLGLGKSAGRAVVDAMREVMQPRLLAMLCILAVFIPAFFMTGISRSLFPPLALAVGSSMIASYLLSSTLVPILAVYLLREASTHATHGTSGPFERVAERFASLTRKLVQRPWLVVASYLIICVPAFTTLRTLPTELFPTVDTGQFQLRIRAPAGTQVERTAEIVRDVEATIRRETRTRPVRTTLANVGNAPWTTPVNAVYTFNAGPHEGVLLVALEDGSPTVAVLQERLRRRLAERFPDVRFSFEAGDIVSQVMSFGAPTPINVTVSAKSLADARRFAERVRNRLVREPLLRDVQIPIALDYPSMRVEVDRTRAAQFGVTMDRVGRAIVTATSSSILTTPVFWTDPASGLPYRIALRVPESEMRTMDDLLGIPVMQDGSVRPVLGDIAEATFGSTSGEVDRYNGLRTVNVTANIAGADLGRAGEVVARVVRESGAPPRGAIIGVHGQVEQMVTTLDGLEAGLGFAVVVVLLLLIANYQSLREPLVVLAVTPAVLAGAAFALAATRTSLNLQSMMGAVMSIGVSVANAVLLVTFARDRWRSGASQVEAIVYAARSRLRPILMTSCAMIVGMIPTAAALGGAGAQAAPLGRAVIGGLIASTLATLLLLPAVYVLIAHRGAPRSASLDPDEPSRSAPERPAAFRPTDAEMEIP